jgi:glutathione S-transferase
VKLYQTHMSPFATRVRIQIYAKGLESHFELVEPPNGVRSDEYRAINPLARIPALEADGVIILESSVICEFIEERFPEPRLLPLDPIARARVRFLMRFVDLYVFAVMEASRSPEESSARAMQDPRRRFAPASLRRAFERVVERFDQLEGFLGNGPYALASELTLADCALAPLFLLATKLMPMAGLGSPMEGRPRLASWWAQVQVHPAVARAFEEGNKQISALIANTDPL